MEEMILYRKKGKLNQNNKICQIDNTADGLWIMYVSCHFQFIVCNLSTPRKPQNFTLKDTVPVIELKNHSDRYRH